MKLRSDIAIVGSGFGGSLLAMIARRLGRSVILLEKKSHPRFAIGESSTPLANLLLEQLATKYDLPEVKPLSRYGTWQKKLPDIGCGLKRGFTFYHHERNRPWEDTGKHERQLLVAASPRDSIADTHWYRQDFDHYLVGEAQRLGVEYFDRVHLDRPDCSGDGCFLTGNVAGRPAEIRCRWLFDASGPRGYLCKHLQLQEWPLPNLPETISVFSHFNHVTPLRAILPAGKSPPYPVDEAAVHHVFDGGWIWVLRFNNGLTSAGAVLRRDWAESLDTREPSSLWQRLLDELPTVREQFSSATLAGEPFHTWSKLAFRCASATGPGWTLLPSAYGFVDPLLSTGFTLNLLGIQRLAGMLERDWNSPLWETNLPTYQRLLQLELDTSALLIGAMYAHMGDFRVFAALSRLYFAAASYTETAMRLNKPDMAGPTFLLSSNIQFNQNFKQCCHDALDLRRASANYEENKQRLLDQIQETIEPFDVAGLTSPKIPNWHPVQSEDLFNNAHKLKASSRDIEDMLRRNGIFEEQKTNF